MNDCECVEIVEVGGVCTRGGENAHLILHPTAVGSTPPQIFGYFNAKDTEIKSSLLVK